MAARLADYHLSAADKSFKGCLATFKKQQESDCLDRPNSISCSHLEQLVDALNLLPNIRTAHPQSSSSTSRNESEDRRCQRTAQGIGSGSVCRHLKIAGRIVFFLISSGYPPPSRIAATQLNLYNPVCQKEL